MASLLSVEDLHSHYGQRRVLRGASLNLGAGEIYVLLGPNGAGKSTLIKAVTGQVRPERGTIRLEGVDPAGSVAARRMIGLVPQNIALYEKLTAGENLAVIGRLMGVADRDLAARIAEALERIALADRVRDRVVVLSGGMRRRVNIAAALIHRPRLLILDEPTVGIDHAGRHAMRDLLFSLRDHGLAILLTTHEIEEAEALADRVGVMIEGRVEAEGAPLDLVQRAFGDQVECMVRLHDGEARGAGVGELIARLRLAYDETTGQWRGLVAPGSADVRTLVERLVEGGGGPRDLRLRRPGLETLMARLLDRREVA